MAGHCSAGGCAAARQGCPPKARRAPLAPLAAPCLTPAMDETHRFVEVVLEVPEALADAAQGLAALAGASGVELRDSETLVPEGAPAPGAGRVQVVAWVDAEADPEGLAASIAARLADSDPGAEIEVRQRAVDPEDWVARVRDRIEPVRVGRRLRVRATWHPPAAPSEGLEEIVLDPGLAFGTGQHPTTYLCLEAVEAVVDGYRRLGIAPSLLDVGSGSGILGIAGARLGARS
ncbi:MAG: hypothetical protein D6729_01315, partial [Deltaproteobacteria bacterium]